MATLSAAEKHSVLQAVEKFMAMLTSKNTSVEIRNEFSHYVAIRHAHGDTHLNQAFDPQYACFAENDFWLLVRGQYGDVLATYCVRRFTVDDFYRLVRSQALWFSQNPRLVHQELTVECEIPPFGGEIVHGGGLWVRQDLRGSSRLAFMLPRLARALSLHNRAFDHDTGMIRNAPQDSPKAAERKAVFAGIRTYGFARVSRFVDGWFPPEGRNAIIHLCHATKAEAIASLLHAVPITGVNGSYRTLTGEVSHVNDKYLKRTIGLRMKNWANGSDGTRNGHPDIGQSASVELKMNHVATSLN